MNTNDGSSQLGTDGGSTVARRSTSQQNAAQQPQPEKAQMTGQSQPQKSQADQDKDDDKARQKAQENLVQSWMDRLQLISVITTFFAAMESQMLSVTTPDSGGTTSAVEDATNAAFLGAMVFHIFAAVAAFLAAFVLVRFKLKEAKKEESKADEGQSPSIAGEHYVGGQRQGDEEKNARSGFFQGSNGEQSHHGSGVWSSNPRMVQTGPWRVDQPPLWLLERCNILCLWTSTIGFLLAFIAIVTFGWANQVQSVGIFGTVCMAVCLLGGALAFVHPGGRR